MSFSIPETAIPYGFITDGLGAHSGRTIMLKELELLLVACSPTTDIAGYRSAILDENVLLKQTESTRKESFRRLRELYGLSLTVANQYLAQLEGDTLDAILGNTGTTIIFRCGVRDARTLAPFVQPTFSSQDLTDLDRFTAVVKAQVNGETLPAFLIETPEPLRRQPDAGAGRVEIRRRVRHQHGTARVHVEGRIAGQLGGGNQHEGIVSDYEAA